MRIDRADADHELLGHLRVGESDGDQSEDIDLTSRQARGVRACLAGERGAAPRRVAAGVGGGVEPARLRNAFEQVLAAIGEGQPCTRGEPRVVPLTRISPGFALAPIRLARCSAMPRTLPSTSRPPRCERRRGSSSSARRADRAAPEHSGWRRRTLERDEEAVAHRVDLLAAKSAISAESPARAPRRASPHGRSPMFSTVRVEPTTSVIRIVLTRRSGGEGRGPPASCAARRPAGDRRRCQPGRA